MKNGYGHMSSPGGNKLTHRVSYEAHVGLIPDGLLVLHRCDVRNCVNPAHLFVGTSHENTLDCMAKDRRITMRGMTHGRAKLDDLSARLIRVSPLSIDELGKIFDVDRTVIANARKGKTWKHLSASPLKKVPSP